MNQVQLNPQQAIVIIKRLMLEKGGLAAMGAYQVPQIVDEWYRDGLTLTLERDSALWKRFVETKEEK